MPDLGDDPFDLDAVLSRLPPGSRAARAAIDVALHDLWGKRLGQPLYRLFGLNANTLPLTSFTIAMDEPSEMARRAKESGYPILKIKLGGGRDEEIVSAIRQATDALLTHAQRLIEGNKQADAEKVKQEMINEILKVTKLANK